MFRLVYRLLRWCFRTGCGFCPPRGLEDLPMFDERNGRNRRSQEPVDNLARVDVHQPDAAVPIGRQPYARATGAQENLNCVLIKSISYLYTMYRYHIITHY